MWRIVVAILIFLAWNGLALYDSIHTYRAFQNCRYKFWILGKAEVILRITQGWLIVYIGIAITLDRVLERTDPLPIGFLLTAMLAVAYILLILRFINARKVWKTSPDDPDIRSAYYSLLHKFKTAIAIILIPLALRVAVFILGYLFGWFS